MREDRRRTPREHRRALRRLQARTAFGGEPLRQFPRERLDLRDLLPRGLVVREARFDFRSLGLGQLAERVSREPCLVGIDRVTVVVRVVFEMCHDRASLTATRSRSVLMPW
jgi:hypothetical protein